MPKVSSRSSDAAAVGALIVLEDEADHSRVVIAPQRGALVTSFSVGGRELLYLDESTLSDATKNVRGGSRLPERPCASRLASKIRERRSCRSRSAISRTSRVVLSDFAPEDCP